MEMKPFIFFSCFYTFLWSYRNFHNTQYHHTRLFALLHHASERVRLWDIYSCCYIYSILIIAHSQDMILTDSITAEKNHLVPKTFSIGKLYIII